MTLDVELICQNSVNVPKFSMFLDIFGLFVCLFVWVHGISTSVGYLIPNPFLYKWTVLFQTIQFSKSTQFNYQKHFYFNLFNWVNQF